MINRLFTNELILNFNPAVLNNQNCGYSKKTATGINNRKTGFSLDLVFCRRYRINSIMPTARFGGELILLCSNTQGRILNTQEVKRAILVFRKSLFVKINSTTMLAKDIPAENRRPLITFGAKRSGILPIRKILETAAYKRISSNSALPLMDFNSSVYSDF